jgi:glycosyltransferase involved in cell wall biosynthesis
MQVSVVIPTYRRTQLLKRCLQALLQQRLNKTQYEIIVVSDGPDAETEKVVKEWEAYTYPALRYIALPYKKGPAAARNLGWLNARGQIIAFTDDDCIPDVHWLTEIIQNFNPQEEDIAITGMVTVPISSSPTDYELNTAGLQTADFITANCACTKKALEKTGGFDERFSMAWREDSDLHFKLMQNEIRIKKVNAARVTHPVRQSSWGVSIKEQKKTMYDALLYKKHPKLFRKKIRSVSPVLYYAIIASFTAVIAGLIFHRNLLTIIGFTAWVMFTAYFIFKRLHTTSRSLSHIAEMIITSLIIPFTSVYWQWYGAIKYRVLFI